MKINVGSYRISDKESIMLTKYGQANKDFYNKKKQTNAQRLTQRILVEIPKTSVCLHSLEIWKGNQSKFNFKNNITIDPKQYN